MSVIDRRSLSIVRAIVRRDWLVVRSYRAAFGLDVISGMLGVALYYFISETFSAVEGSDLAGAPSYFAFALVGIVTITVINSAALGVGRRIREEQLTGTLEAMVAQPLRDGEIALGLAAYPFLNASVRSALYLVTAGLVFGVDFSQADWVGAVLVFLATTAFVVGVGLFVAALVLLLKRAEVVASLATMILALLGGAYFPVSVLPSWLAPLAEIAPTRLAFDAGRAALYRGEGWTGDTAILALLGAIAVPLGVFVFGRALEQQRRKGTLVEY